MLLTIFTIFCSFILRFWSSHLSKLVLEMNHFFFCIFDCSTDSQSSNEGNWNLYYYHGLDFWLKRNHCFSQFKINFEYASVSCHLLMFIICRHQTSDLIRTIGGKELVRNDRNLCYNALKELFSWSGLHCEESNKSKWNVTLIYGMSIFLKISSCTGGFCIPFLNRMTIVAVILTHILYPEKCIVSNEKLVKSQR